MTTRINPGGWSAGAPEYAEVTASHLNQIDGNLVRALDGEGGGRYWIQSQMTFSGEGFGVGTMEVQRYLGGSTSGGFLSITPYGASSNLDFTIGSTFYISGASTGIVERSDDGSIAPRDDDFADTSKDFWMWQSDAEKTLGLINQVDYAANQVVATGADPARPESGMIIRITKNLGVFDIHVQQNASDFLVMSASCSYCEFIYDAQDDEWFPIGWSSDVTLT